MDGEMFYAVVCKCVSISETADASQKRVQCIVVVRNLTVLDIENGFRTLRSKTDERREC